MFDIIFEKLSAYLGDVNVFLIIGIALAAVILFTVFIVRWVVKNWKFITKIKEYFANKKKAEQETRTQISTLLTLTQKLTDDLATVKEKVEKENERLDNLEKQTNENTDHIKIYEVNRVHDRQQSFDKQNAIDHNFVDVKGSIDEIKAVLTEMQEKDDEREKARLKSSISRLYRECYKEKKWTCMQKDTMESMIASYQNCRFGNNSFIHSVVIPEIYTWEIVDEDD